MLVSRSKRRSVETMGKKIKNELSRSVQTMANVNLPSDAVESDILTRLPVKTLIRFRAVDKSWYSLISDPFFINMHNQIQKKRNNLLLIENNITDSIEIINRSCWKVLWSSNTLNGTGSKKYFNLKMVGCFNGIVCVSATIKNSPSLNNTGRGLPIGHIILCNPALRIKKIVHRDPRISIGNGVCLGFGYHSQTNDYMVIRFTNSLSSLRTVKIYSTNSNSWRKIKIGGKDQELINPYLISYRSPVGVYVSCFRGGAYFWMARKTIKGERRIISFHMEDEVFKEMLIPYNSGSGKISTHNTNTLFIYKDSSLAVFQTESDSDINTFKHPRPQLLYTICYIWVLKDYNDPRTWTILRKFDSERPQVSFMGIVQSQVFLTIFGNFGEWEIINRLESKVFDIDKSEMSSINKDMIICFVPGKMRVTSFSESLISIF